MVMRSNDLGRLYGRTEGVTPLSVNGDVGTSHVTASTPPEGGTIIDLNKPSQVADMLSTTKP
jgi:hypothetical protein